jgi:oligosaccharide repeat unit polymerase
MEILNYIFAFFVSFSYPGAYICFAIAILFLYKYWKVIRYEPLLFFIILFMVYGCLLAFFSEYQKEAFNEMYAYFMNWCGAFILGYFFINKTRKIRLVLTYVSFFVFILFLSIMSYYGLFFKEILGFKFLMWGRLSADMYPIGCAALCLLISCILLILLLFKLDVLKQYKIILFVMYVISIIALFLTGSRGYYISGFITYFLIFSFYYYKTRSVKILVGFILTFFVIISGIFLTNVSLQERIQKTSLTADESITTRFELYHVALLIFKDHPIFGVGPSNGGRQFKYFQIASEKLTEYGHLHSIYLNILADFGIIGFILFILIIICLFRRLIQVYKEQNSLLALALIFSWISLLIGDTFDVFLSGNRVAMEYFWLTGIVLGGTQNKKNDIQNHVLKNEIKQIKFKILFFKKFLLNYCLAKNRYKLNGLE